MNAICRTFPGAEVYDPWSGRHDGSPGSPGSCTLHLILPFCSPRPASTADKIRLLPLRSIQNEVRRIADVEAWGSVAEEELLDRRKAGPFYGRGSLIAAATEALKPAWETGSAAAVQAAMN